MYVRPALKEIQLMSEEEDRKLANPSARLLDSCFFCTAQEGLIRDCSVMHDIASKRWVETQETPHSGLEGALQGN